MYKPNFRKKPAPCQLLFLAILVIVRNSGFIAKFPHFSVIPASGWTTPLFSIIRLTRKVKQELAAFTLLHKDSLLLQAKACPVKLGNIHVLLKAVRAAAAIFLVEGKPLKGFELIDTPVSRLALLQKKDKPENYGCELIDYVL